MDNLCHTLTGAALAEAGLKHRTRFASAALMIAANLPTSMSWPLRPARRRSRSGAAGRTACSHKRCCLSF
jgi:hypothetical protein